MCFGGRLMRGNRCQKTHSSFYQAFDSLSYPYLANLGVDVDWKKSALLEVKGVYRPRFEVPPPLAPRPCGEKLLMLSLFTTVLWPLRGALRVDRVVV